VNIIAPKRWRTWRQLLSCVVAYAFALQLVLFGLAAPAIAAVSADQSALSAGLCLHDSGAPLAPAGNSGGEEHCKFCTAAAHTVFAPPPAPYRLVALFAETTTQPAEAQFVAGPIAHATPQPRGPPRTA
jgi:hypothetical protein